MPPPCLCITWMIFTFHLWWLCISVFQHMPPLILIIYVYLENNFLDILEFISKDFHIIFFQPFKWLLSIHSFKFFLFPTMTYSSFSCFLLHSFKLAIYISALFFKLWTLWSQELRFVHLCLKHRVQCLSHYRTQLYAQVNCTDFGLFMEKLTIKLKSKSLFYEWWNREEGWLVQVYTANLWQSRRLPNKPCCLAKWIQSKTASITISSTHI